jgi:threonine dehydrogenase-like Zn-dependent dehydrogenase
MKGVLQTGLRRLEVCEVDRPVAGPGMAVARVNAVGVCGSDLHNYFCRPGAQSVPDGHEISGVVVAVGEGVSNVQVGDRVAVDNITVGRGCGVCTYCRSGNHLHCVAERAPIGWGFSQYVPARSAGFFRLTEVIDDRLGALVEPVAVGVHAVRWMGMKPGASVAIVGAGTIGLCTLFAARSLGCERVYISAKHPFQAAAARRLGAAAVLPTEAGKLVEAVKDLTGGLGADYVVEAVGGSDSLVDLACALARPQGNVGIVGIYPGERVTVNVTQIQNREATITTPLCYSIIDGRHDFEVAVDIVAAQPDAVRSMITHEFKLDDISAAFATAANKGSGSIKVMVRP